MNPKHLLFLLLLLLFVPLESLALEELNDLELNAVTAGSSDPAFGTVETLTHIPFRYASSKGEVDGEVFVMPMTDIRNQGTMQLRDNAQSNLRSFINVNAVNSPVQILLNLNVNIHSTIGNVNQLNNLLSQQGL